MVKADGETLPKRPVVTANFNETDWSKRVGEWSEPLDIAKATTSEKWSNGLRSLAQPEDPGTSVESITELVFFRHLSQPAAGCVSAVPTLNLPTHHRHEAHEF